VLRVPALSHLTAPVRSFSAAAAAAAPSVAEKKYEYLTVEMKGRVGVVTLNRPKALNALCDGLMKELLCVLKGFDADPNCGAIVLTGSERAFAAGADIKEMAPKTYMQAYGDDMLASWAGVGKTRTPVIAAVNGFALGGGCELAMMCDIIVAGENAKFGQPEITLGLIPGGGGSQRLTKAVGKSKSMELILTGAHISAQEAQQYGLVSHVLPVDKTVPKALEIAEKIASFSKPIAQLCKEAVNYSFETNLETGINVERRLFHTCFATKDQKEGCDAFANKRKPTWTHN